MRSKFLSLFILLCLFSCSKTEEGPKPEPCDEDKIFEHGMVRFTGDFGSDNCHFTLEKYQTATGEFYYLLNCNCCDLAAWPINCAGDRYCENENCQGSLGLEFVATIGIAE